MTKGEKMSDLNETIGRLAAAKKMQVRKIEIIPVADRQMTGGYELRVRVSENVTQVIDVNLSELIAWGEQMKNYGMEVIGNDH